MLVKTLFINKGIADLKKHVMVTDDVEFCFIPCLKERDDRNYEVRRLKGNFEVKKIIAKVYHPHYRGEFEDEVRIKDNIFMLPRYCKYGTFKCYIKRLDSFGPAGIHVLNPDGVIINDQTEDYHCYIGPKEEDMKVTLTFAFN
uniref:Uncharacterized protein n=1 Tax=Panagrolaimus sp. ES5 TaxID=591445 RepID=A0AC34F1N6_9BILA